MFLARSEIERLSGDGWLIGRERYDKKYVRQCSYDLRLGEEVYLVGEDVPRRLSEYEPYISLPPGQVAILTCYEEINMPEDHMAFIALKSSYKFQGLVNISGFHVDPTYVGTLLFAVQNVGPSDLRLKFKEQTFTIFFSELKGSTGASRKQEAGTQFKGLTGIQLQHVQQLGGSSITISKLQKEIEQLKFIVLVFTPVAVAIVAALVKLFWPSSPPVPSGPH